MIWSMATQVGLFNNEPTPPAVLLSLKTCLSDPHFDSEGGRRWQIMAA